MCVYRSAEMRTIHRITRVFRDLYLDSYVSGHMTFKNRINDMHVNIDLRDMNDLSPLPTN